MNKGFNFLTVLASPFGHCGGLSCVFLIKRNLFFLAIRLSRILINCRNKTRFVELESCFKFGLKDMSLAFLIKTSGYCETHTKRNNSVARASPVTI